MAVLSELGSIASLVGLPLSLIALISAIYHLVRLRGETRAAKDAAEETQALLRTDMTLANLLRLNERIQGLIDLLRTGERERALERFPEIRNLFTDIRRRHPDLDLDHRSQLQDAVTTLWDIQINLEAISGAIPSDFRARAIGKLTGFQFNLIVELEDRLGQNA